MNEPIIRPAQMADLEEIHFCENACLVPPWTYAMLYDDIIENNHTYYCVVELDGKIIGYGGMWIVIDEAHITNVCILPEYRKRGFAILLMRELMSHAKKCGAISLSLEVRVSNKGAISLYRKCGFSIHGLRKKYYSNDGEDAYVMWTERGIPEAKA